MDEIDSIFNHFATESLERRLDAFRTLMHLIKGAGYIFAGDVDLSDMSLKVLFQLRKKEECLLYYNNYKNQIINAHYMNNTMH